MESTLENFNELDVQRRIDESLLPDGEKKTLLDFAKDIHIDGVRREPSLEANEGKKGAGKPFSLKHSPIAMSVNQMLSVDGKMTEDQYDFILAHEIAALISVIRHNGISERRLEEIKQLYLAYYNKCSRKMRLIFMVDMIEWITPSELLALEPTPRTGKGGLLITGDKRTGKTEYFMDIAKGDKNAD